MKSLRQLFTAIMLLCCGIAAAHDFEVGGIFYKITSSSSKEVAVTYSGSSFSAVENEYTGDVVIPESVTYNDVTYSVTSIGNSAFYHCFGLTSVTIGNSVTSIGNSAFCFCSGLTSVTIGNSVTSIGDGAFYYCSGLTSVTIGNSVTSIGYMAFESCTGLTSIEIPNSVTSIGRYAFYKCSGLASIEIPNSVTSIGNYAFSDCSGLTSIIVESGNSKYDSRENCNAIIETESNTLIAGCKNSVIPGSVTSIGNSAFSGRSGLTSVTIPNSVTSIGNYAFSDCSNLTSVTIPNSVTSIGDYAFEDCSGLTSIEIPNSVTTIGESTFYKCSGLTSITIPNSITSIEENAFCSCTALKKVELHCTMLGKWFSGSSSVKEIVIGNEVTSIDAAAFNGCSALESVIIGNGITELNDGMFDGCSKLESITIGSKVNSISKSCFVGCDIKKCFWLTNTPPVGYETVGAEVNYVANNKYEELENVKVYSYLSSYFEADGIRYIPVSLSDRTCDIVDCVSWNGIEDFVVNDKASYKGIELTVNNIMPYSFYNNNNFDNLNLNNCGGIGDFAFANSTDMNSVALCGNITYIGSYAFENCEKITGIAVPAAVEKIGNGAFKGCALLAELIVEDRGEELLLGSNGSEPLFNDCPLDSVYIGGNITYDTSEQYGYSPFYNNKTLRTVVISNYEEEIPDNEFYGCSNLKNVTIGDGVKSIGKWAFSGCSSLDYFAFGKNLQSIGEEAFSDCTNVGKIVSKAKTPPVCDTQALDDIDKWNCTLYVPEKQIAEYQSAEQWKEFLFVEGVQAIEYTVTYIIDGKEYKTEAVEFGAEITLPVVEEKKGYTFEWIDAPATMPAEDITIEGKYTADTAIDLVELDTEEEIMFDLNGHRILDKELLTRGLYIINGKKTVIK